MIRDLPQRIARIAPPGALLKDVFDLTLRLRPAQNDDDPNYLAAIRQLPCLKCGMEPSESAHLRMQSGAHGKRSAMGKKPAERHALPLCADCHRLDREAQHKIGERAFWGNLGLNPFLIADRLYAQRGDLVAMRAVILNAIADRGK